MKGLFVILVAVGLASASVDLTSSVDRIAKQIQVTKDKQANWAALPVIIEDLLKCLADLGGIFEVRSGQLPSSIVEYIENFRPKQFAEQLLKVDWAEVQAKGSDIEPTAALQDLIKFMNDTDKFDPIHIKVWGDGEFLDLVGYLYEAGYPNIYITIKGLYSLAERDDLANGPVPIPDEPPTLDESAFIKSETKRKTRSVGDAPAYSNFPTITMKSGILKQEEMCGLPELLGVLSDFNKSNIHEIVKVLLYTVQEIIGNAAMHILMMKLGETGKGVFFNATLNMAEMNEFLPIVQGLVLENTPIGQINEIVRQVTGLTLVNLDLFKYIINLIKYLVWNHPFP